MLLLQGQVLIKGKARKGLLADDKDLASQLKVGMVFQNGALFDSLNVRENVGFMLYEHSNLPSDRIEVRVHLESLLSSIAHHLNLSMSEKTWTACYMSTAACPLTTLRSDFAAQRVLAEP